MKASDVCYHWQCSALADRRYLYQGKAIGVCNEHNTLSLLHSEVIQPISECQWHARNATSWCQPVPAGDIVISGDTHLEVGRKIIEVLSEGRYGRNLAPLLPDDMLRSLGEHMTPVLSAALAEISEIVAQFEEAS